MALADTAGETTASKVLTASAVLLAVLMVILDMTVVNVALPHMMGELGATPDQITWVLTSYIVAEGIVIPTSGFLAARFGRKNVIIVSVAGFVVASMLCGQSETLAQMVVFRLLQGALAGPATTAALLGVGHYLPEATITNEDLAGLVDTSDAWIVPRTGIRSGNHPPTSHWSASPSAASHSSVAFSPRK